MQTENGKSYLLEKDGCRYFVINVEPAIQKNEGCGSN
jgi:hypothetical protein